MASAGALFALSLALYASTIPFGYIQYDDQAILLKNPNLFDGDLWKNLEQIFVGYLPREEPLLLRDLTWALESWLFGMNAAWARHLGNVLLNAANAALAFLYLRELTRRSRFAFACALAWSLLAIRVEPVSWVMGRKDLLCAFFVLCALLLELRGPRLASATGRRVAWATGLAATLLALLSKISALPLFLLLGMQHAFRDSLDPESAPKARLALPPLIRIALRFAPHAAVSAAVYLWYSKNVEAFGVTNHGPGFSLEYARTLLDFLPLVFTEYGQLLLFPFEFSISHAWPTMAIALNSAEVAASRVALGGLLGLTAVLAWKRRDLLFYWLAFAALMAPYLNLVYIGIWIADRYLYLSSLFLIALVAAAARQVLCGGAGIARAAIAGALGGILLLNGVQVLLQQRVWRSNEALWTYEVARAEPSLLSFHALAKEYLDQAEREPGPGRRAELLHAANETIEHGLRRFASLPLLPVSAYLTSERFFASKLYYQQGRLLGLAGAPLAVQLAAYQKAEEADPTAVVAIFALARTLFDLGLQAEGAEREDLLRRSFDSFARYARWAVHDAKMRPGVRKTLEENYAGRFPFLERDVAALREELSGGHP